MVRKEDFLAALGKKNFVIAQLLEDWMDLSDPSFWRFFNTLKDLEKWGAFVLQTAKKYDATFVLVFKSDIRGIILVLDTCVIRTYRTARFMKIRPLYRLRSPYLEKCLQSKNLGHLGVFVCEKIEPLINMETLSLFKKFGQAEKEQLFHDITKAMDKIHSYGYCHNDVSIDNSAYNPETGNYVLFDYDAVSRYRRDNASCQDEDYNSFHRSLKAWKLSG